MNMICVNQWQWRAEEGATAPGIQPGGIQRRSFLKKCIGKCQKSKGKCIKSEEQPRASRIMGASGKMFRKKRERKSRNWEK